ncbi:uncharacterized protein G2W53_022296 [Senna tora]|uniref:Uncharacterized protein n=1 Tax=Senna tora TaxID=362788 RepID=A0A834WIM1_9FABA|nr:uncharacterized protein G2W53_022296 [Senna tora]
MQVLHSKEKGATYISFAQKIFTLSTITFYCPQDKKARNYGGGAETKQVEEKMSNG